MTYETDQTGATCKPYIRRGRERLGSTVRGGHFGFEQLALCLCASAHLFVDSPVVLLLDFVTGSATSWSEAWRSRVRDLSGKRREDRRQTHQTPCDTQRGLP